MRCKPGDIALIVRSRYPENIGGLVVVIRSGKDWDWEAEALQTLTVSYRGDTANPVRIHAGERLGANDKSLKPVRDDVGEDETLTWAPVPGERIEA